MTTGKRWLGSVVVLVLLLVAWAGWAKAQYGGYGLPDQAYGYGYSLGYPYGFPTIPPPYRYMVPSFSYNPNPYGPYPNAFSYEVPQNAYAPNSFNYDLRAYGYGYLPPLPQYQPPSYPYGYYPNYYYYPSYYYPRRPYRRDVYRRMTLQAYMAIGLQGPTRVRDIVPGVPELGG